MPINGKSYDWEDITILLPNGPQLEVTDIEYSDEMPSEGRYGKGSAPRGYGTGKWSGEGKLTLNREGYDALMGYCLAKGKAYYKLPKFNITASYANDDSGLRVDKLQGCKFNKRSFKAASGDTSNTVEVPFNIFDDLISDGVSAHGNV
ncbi:MAG: hypothetical protein P9M14_06860 [Candidatus Alcyoniella australis]|nr:hypothetical protein [Candidatus Alcyoniella australis]